MPGDPVVHIIGEDEYLRLEAEAPEVIEEVRREYGLDKPLPVQYITYLNTVSYTHLDVYKRQHKFSKQVSWLAARHVLRLLTCETCNGNLQHAPRLQ